MKKILFIIMALYLCHTVFSQETEEVKFEQKDELKVNLFALSMIIPEIVYERILTEKMGVGISAGPSRQWGKNQHETETDNNFYFQITPYYRYYYIKTLFIEANTQLARFHYYTKLGVGYALGCKFVSKKGYIGEVYIGRGHFGSWNGGYIRLGFSVGKQF